MLVSTCSHGSCDSMFCSCQCHALEGASNAVIKQVLQGAKVDVSKDVPLRQGMMHALMRHSKRSKLTKEIIEKTSAIAKKTSAKKKSDKKAVKAGSIKVNESKSNKSNKSKSNTRNTKSVVKKKAAPKKKKVSACSDGE